jgi:hypothetical protein
VGVVCGSVCVLRVCECVLWECVCVLRVCECGVYRDGDCSEM